MGGLLLGVTSRRLMGHVTGGMNQAGVLGRVAIDCSGAVQNRASLWQGLVAKRAEPFLLFHLELLQAPPDHRLAALVVHQFLVDLAAVGKEQFLVAAAQVHEPRSHFIEQGVGEVELFGRQSGIGHALKIARIPAAQNSGRFSRLSRACPLSTVLMYSTPLTLMM